MKMTFKIEGGAELRRRLRALPARVERAAAQKALPAGGRVLAKEMKALVDVRKGDLRNSITVARTASFAERDRNPHVFVGPRHAMGARASWEELGTIKQAPDPFIRPAMDNVGAEAVRVVGVQLAAQIEKAGG